MIVSSRRASYTYIKANVVSVCVFVTDIRGLQPCSRCGGPSRARCHDLLYIHCGCVMQFWAKRCAQRARRGCTEHNGRTKPAWAVRIKPVRAPHSVRRSRVPTSFRNVHHPPALPILNHKTKIILNLNIQRSQNVRGGSYTSSPRVGGIIHYK